MKLGLLFLVLIGTVAVCRAEAGSPGLEPAISPGVEAELRRVAWSRSIVIGVIDPCRRPHPPPHCQSRHAPPTPAQNYTRPCAKFNWCRSGPPRREAIVV
ncbi:hypothetical protein ACJRO7_030135 [Eucalyptus globulus]|uniref:Uncharacterized protein n=1 Tax=Eucalyptus globulus TaxID=34317 RepID=A0ABD3JCN8_EUCGL